MRVSLEFTTHVEENGELVLVCQADGDLRKLQAWLAHDKDRLVLAAWDPDGRTLRFTQPKSLQVPEVSAAEPSADDAAELKRLMALSPADLEVEAATAGVKWDKKSSKQAMVERILAVRRGPNNPA